VNGCELGKGMIPQRNTPASKFKLRRTVLPPEP